MRPILSLAGWNWRMARRPYAILCAVFAAQQLAVLLVQAQDPDNTGRSLANLYRDGVQFLAFGLAFLLAGLLAGPASNDQKWARCSYTGSRCRCRRPHGWQGRCWRPPCCSWALWRCSLCCTPSARRRCARLPAVRCKRGTARAPCPTLRFMRKS